MPRRSAIATLTLSLAVTVTLTGCSAIGAATKPGPAASTAATADLFAAPAMDQAVQAIAKKVGASPMKVLELDVYADYVQVDAVDPAKPTEVNRFTYRDGQVQDPRPVDISDSDPGALEQNIFDSTSVKPEVLAKLLADSPAAANIEGAKASSAAVKRMLPFSSDIQIIVDVQGTRATKQVKATVDGKVIGID
ncbi:hypothetical protein [Kitasatospora sp. NBC_01302]|uniref:hypothetical protein n=1 Tax=Kitasatospora sp. NBC_01302 TaxID=2903575 RepID=UPI002E0DA2B6|nr:hypothetical protein OG294_34510 [Kitasatospora sp. NBC_01302]